MPILFSIVSRGSVVLARYAECVGNFTEVTDQILPRIQLDNHKLTYLHGNYLIHYICENRVVYLCITDDRFDRARAFQFLHDIYVRFIATYGLASATAIAYAMNSEFSRVLSEQMRNVNEGRQQGALTRVNSEIGELKDIMVKNIENITHRGERLELLVNQAENLRNNSVTFRQTSRNLARTMFWRNVRMYFLVAAIVLFVVYVIVSMACGGLLWKGCIAPAPKQPPPSA